MFPKKYRIEKPLPLDADDVTQRNWELYLSPESTYEAVHGYRRMEWEIKGSETEEDVQTIIDRFPENETIESQCGYWVRAVSGVHPFQDANHRTATQTLRYILNKSSYNIKSITPKAIERCVDESKNLKEEPDAIEVDVDNLHEKDELFRLWRDYFEFELWKEYLQGRMSY
jgi:hypothetical protein